MNRLLVLLYLTAAVLCPAQAGLTAERVAELALAAATDWQVAEARWRAGYAAARFDWSVFLPRISLEYRDDEQLRRYGVDSFRQSLSLSLEQLVYDSGHSRAALLQQRQRLYLERLVLDSQARSLADRAVLDWYGLLALRLRMELRRSARSLAEDQLAVLALELELGRLLGYEYRNAVLRLRELDLDIIQGQVEEAYAAAALAGRLGLLPADLDGSLPPFSLAAPSLDRQRLVEAGLAASLELLRASLDLCAAAEQARLTSRAWLPTVNVYGQVSLGGSRLPLTEWRWSAGCRLEFSAGPLAGRSGLAYGQDGPLADTAAASLSCSLLPGPLSLDRVSQALAWYGSAEALARLRLDLGLSLGLAVDEYQRLAAMQRLAVERLELAAERLALAEQALALGRLRPVDLLESRLAHLERGLEAVDAGLRLWQATVELEARLRLPAGQLASFGRTTDETLY